jgi:glycosyltransferase involved in cell wall biosynthesis
VQQRPDAISLLYVTTVSGTIAHFLTPYAEHFRALGWRVDAAARGAGSDARLIESFDHVNELPLSRSMRDVGALWRGERAVAKLLLDSRPDIVHVHTPIAAFVTRLAVRRMPAARRPLVAYTAHGFHFHEGGRVAVNAAFVAAEKVAGRWTDRLVVINDEDHKAARQHRIVRSGRLVQMPGIGVDTARYKRDRIPPAEIADARRRMGVDADAPLFVIVGELNRNKRQQDVIEALALMRHSEAHLALVGDGPAQADLEALVQASGLAARVHLTGLVRDVRPLVATATALVLSSSREGLPRSIMEALSMGVPVIASTARGCRELVGTDAGAIVAAGDVRGYAAAMDRFIDNPQERDAMGQRGRARMIEDYELQVLIRLHESMYMDMLDTSRHGHR